jgi:hypothetical protein
LNLWPSACKADALPAELPALVSITKRLNLYRKLPGESSKKNQTSG